MSGLNINDFKNKLEKSLLNTKILIDEKKFDGNNKLMQKFLLN